MTGCGHPPAIPPRSPPPDSRCGVIVVVVVAVADLVHVHGAQEVAGVPTTTRRTSEDHENSKQWRTVWQMMVQLQAPQDGEVRQQQMTDLAVATTPTNPSSSTVVQMKVRWQTVILLTLLVMPRALRLCVETAGVSESAMSSVLKVVAESWVTVRQQR